MRSSVQENSIAERSSIRSRSVADVFTSCSFGESDGIVVFYRKVEDAVEAIFEHLGEPVKYKCRDESYKTVIAVGKSPENLYSASENQIVEQAMEVSVKSAEITLQVGDSIIVNDKTFRIFEEPLLDASGLIWKFTAVLV